MIHTGPNGRRRGAKGSPHSVPARGRGGGAPRGATRGLGTSLLRLLGMLVDPTSALRSAVRDPQATRLTIVLVLSLVVLSLGTLPRQLALLAEVLAGPDSRYALMRPGLVRLIVVDRLVPPPSLVLAAGVLVLLAEPALGIARHRRAALVAVAVLGLAPVGVQRVGELVVTYAAAVARTPGAVVELPHRFVSGPLLVWSGRGAPTWMHVVDARVNLVALWCVVLWSLGLKELVAARLGPWRFALPVMAVMIAGVMTWAFSQPFLLLLLGRP